MSATVINGRDGTADFSIAGASHRCFLDMMRFREVIEMTTSDTFCVEGVADQEPGRSQLVGEIAGIGKKGIANAGPLIPAPQNVAIVGTISTGCTISFTANFTEAYVDRVVNATCRIGARFLSKPPIYVVSWVQT